MFDLRFWCGVCSFGKTIVAHSSSSVSTHRSFLRYTQNIMQQIHDWIWDSNGWSSERPQDRKWYVLQQKKPCFGRSIQLRKIEPNRFVWNKFVRTSKFNIVGRKNLSVFSPRKVVIMDRTLEVSKIELKNQVFRRAKGLAYSCSFKHAFARLL